MKTILDHVRWWARKKGFFDYGDPEEEVFASLARVMESALIRARKAEVKKKLGSKHL